MKLPFKTPEAFLEYCNARFPSNPRKGEGRPALIPHSGFMEIENHVSRTEDGRYRVSLVVCGTPSGFFTISETPIVGGDSLRSGDLVIWKAFKKPMFAKVKIGRLTGDSRSNWVGFIVAKIAPEIDAATGKFTILSGYQ